MFLICFCDQIAFQAGYFETDHDGYGVYILPFILLVRSAYRRVDIATDQWSHGNPTADRKSTGKWSIDPWKVPPLRWGRPAEQSWSKDTEGFTVLFNV